MECESDLFALSNHDVNGIKGEICLLNINPCLTLIIKAIIPFQERISASDTLKQR